MPSQIQPHVGQRVQLTRSGHSHHASENATVVAVYGQGHRTVLRVRWCEGRETFVPASALGPKAGDF